jgi:hypothetical protein
VENSDDKDSPQPSSVVVETKKKSPFKKFVSDFKEGIHGFSEKTGSFFLKVRKDFTISLKNLKASWKRMLQNMRENDPKYRRFKKLYTKLEKMEAKISEIQDDTREIKLKVSQVVFMIEYLMDDIKNVEEYMKKNLGSDWAIIKDSWRRVKNKEISKKEFIKTSLLKLGKKFVGVFV